MSKTPAVGIDLGTTYSCVGVWQQGNVYIIANEYGNRTTPSCVAFTDTERLLGEAAKQQAAFNPKNTVYDGKRLIGRRYDDPKLVEDMAHWPFEVVDENSKPKIRVEFKGATKTFSPEEISSMVLARMKEIAEKYLGGTVTDAVVTVPAYFNDAQRQATKDAGAIAGLNILRIFSEPNAGALAYGLGKMVKGKVLIFDLGGGTFDVSILEIDDGCTYKVLSTAGDTHLGGEDFDSRLVNHFKAEFKRKYRRDISDNPKAMRRLRTAAELAKRTLSAMTEASIDIDALDSGVDFHSKIFRARFEDLCADLFQSTLAPVEQALKDANLIVDDIDDVVLIGGSSRVPRIQQLLQKFFKGKQLNSSINPDEAVAYGAAVQAAVLSGDESIAIFNVNLFDVTPLSLGTEMKGGIMATIIERNSRIPCTKSRYFTTVSDNQTSVLQTIFEGERPMAKYNNFLGSFVLKGIPPAPRGTAIIKVTFSLDADSILNVTAEDTATGNRNNLVIEYEGGRLSKEEIKRMMNDAERYKTEDMKQKNRALSRNSLENYILDTKRDVNESGDTLSDDEKLVCNEVCELAFHWLECSNVSAEKEQYDAKLKILRQICDPILIILRRRG